MASSLLLIKFTGTGGLNMKQYENYPTESKCGATRRSAWPPTRSLTLRSMILGILIFALAISPGAAFALTGNGTSESPYEISKAEELAEFRDIVNKGSADAHAKLTKNITLSSENWTPIGNDDDTAYTGAFDGCGYKITGLKIKDSLTSAGLFGYLNGGTVENLTLDGVSITQISDPIDYAGGIAGYSTSGKAINCSVAGEISGDEVGGIFGAADGTTVENCSNTSTVNGDYAGGIVGAIYGKDNRIAFCSNGGAVNADPYGGGIVGYMYDGSETVLDCCLNNISVKSTIDAGGIAGVLDINSTAELSSCSNTGDVEANNAGYTQEVYAGGIFGTISRNTTATLKNCSNGGHVTAFNDAEERYSYAGGIAGYISNNGSAITLTYCVNGGAVKADSDKGTEYRGGIAGYVYDSALSSVTECAYLTGMEALGGNSYSGELTVSGADARGDAASLVVAVYAEIAPKSIAPGKTATITFKTAPRDNRDNVTLVTEDTGDLKAPASSSSDIAKVEGWNTSDKTITVTGVSEGTAVIEFSVMLQVTQIGDKTGDEPTPCSFAIPVTVTAIPSDPTDPDDPNNPDDPSQPTDPDDPSDPSDPDDLTDPDDPTDPNDPDAPSQPTDPGNSGGGGGGCSAGFGALALLAIAPLALKRRK